MHNEGPLLTMQCLHVRMKGIKSNKRQDQNWKQL